MIGEGCFCVNKSLILNEIRVPDNSQLILIDFSFTLLYTACLGCGSFGVRHKHGYVILHIIYKQYNLTM